VFKNKGFLYGLGLGLILGASLLYLMNIALIKTNNLTDDLPAIPSTPQATETVKPTPTVAPFKAIATLVPVATTNAPATALPVKSVKPSTPVTPDASADVPTNINVIINEGMNSSDVAELLFDKGVILDLNGFEKLLDKLKLDRVIHYGSYTFSADQNMDEVINQITTLKKSLK